jgi:hypothetical protein
MRGTALTLRAAPREAIAGTPYAAAAIAGPGRGPGELTTHRIGGTPLGIGAGFAKRRAAVPARARAITGSVGTPRGSRAVRRNASPARLRARGGAGPPCPRPARNHGSTGSIGDAVRRGSGPERALQAGIWAPVEACGRRGIAGALSRSVGKAWLAEGTSPGASRRLDEINPRVTPPLARQCSLIPPDGPGAST